MVQIGWKGILSIAAIAGIGYVIYKFAKGDWKLPDLSGLLKLPEISLPHITLPSIIFPDQPVGATLPEAVFAEAIGSKADPIMIRLRELTGLPYAAPPEILKKTPEELGLAGTAPIYTPTMPEPMEVIRGLEYLQAQGVTPGQAEFIYAGGVQGIGREVMTPYVAEIVDRRQTTAFLTPAQRDILSEIKVKRGIR